MAAWAHVPSEATRLYEVKKGADLRYKKGNKGYGRAAKRPEDQTLRILNKAGTSFVNGKADSIAFIYILELGDTQYWDQRGR